MTTNTTTTSAVEMFIENGFLPTDDFDFGSNTARVADWMTRRYDAIIDTDYGYLAATERDDSVTLVRFDMNCCTLGEIRFDAPDGEIDAATAAAFDAVVGAWS